MGSQIDGVVLVVWGGKTSREAVKRAKEKLDAMKMPSLGVIINRINLREHDYYYKHHYYHYYGES
jgi:Mrp family chromosome partitioning ATPase